MVEIGLHSRYGLKIHFHSIALIVVCESVLRV